MAARIVLFGATGYTGRLTAEAMVERGVLPVLAARGRDRVEAMAADLGGLDTFSRVAAQLFPTLSDARSADELERRAGDGRSFYSWSETTRRAVEALRRDALLAGARIADERRPAMPPPGGAADPKAEARG